MKHILNLNEMVLVDLTEHGHQVWNSSDWGKIAPLATGRKRLSAQMWVFMSVFGPHFGNGYPQVVEHNEMQVFCGKD